METTERSYIAFISYRHTPLDREAATAVQKKIENFVVPKEFREKVGGKKLGLCFRDEDELPASSSLTDSIYYALDHTKFLIVICTPNLPLSKWCEAEIKYFLKTHDRDHLLAVLADGTPDVSFSPLMLHEYDEEGGITRDIEPLAANIAGPDHTIDKKALNKEIVRLYAAMIGCAFDELWQRERRARTNRLLALAGVAVAVMAVFLGVVMNRNARIEAANAQISEQNEQINRQNEDLTEKNEEIQQQNERITEQNEKIEEQNTDLQKQISTVLVDSGQTKLDNYDRAGAIADALEALESGDPDIYDHRAEKLLSDALGTYGTNYRRSNIVYEQSTDIRDMALSESEEYIYLSDDVGVIRCVDTKNYEVLWEYQCGDSSVDLYTEHMDGRLLAKTGGGLYCLSEEDGSVLWSFEHIKYTENKFFAITKDGSQCAVLATPDENDSVVTPNTVEIVFLNTKDGSEAGRTALASENYTFSFSSGYSRLRFAAAFSDGGSRFACSIPARYENESGDTVYTTLSYLIDTDTFEKENVVRIDNINLFYGISCYDDSDDVFIAAYASRSGSIWTVLCSKGEDGYEYNDLLTSHDLTSSDGGMYYDYDNVLQNSCTMLSLKDTAILFSDNRMLIFDRYTNKLRRTYSLDGRILNAFWLDEEKDTFEIMTDAGWCLCYRMGTEYLILGVYGLGVDQTGIKNILPKGGGIIGISDTWYDNTEGGACYTILNGSPKKLLLSQFTSDPNGITADLDYDEIDYLSEIFTVPGSDVVYYQYGSHDILTFSGSDGKFSDQAAFDGLFLNSYMLAVDEEHFLSGNNLCSMDGTITEYVSPAELDDFNTFYPSRHLRLIDGSILSYYPDSNVFLSSSGYKIDDDFRYGGYSYLYPLWIDGEPVENSLDPEAGLTIYSEDGSGGSDHCFTAGENGYVCVYGKKLDLSDSSAKAEENSSYQIMNAHNGEILQIEDPLPDEGAPLLAMSSDQPVMAAVYNSGKVVLFDISSGTYSIMDQSYTTGEITAADFIKGTRYLALLSSTGRLDVIDTESGDLMFSETIDAVKENVAASGNPYEAIEGCMTKDDAKILVIAKAYDNSDYGSAVFIDPYAWTVAQTCKNAAALNDAGDRIYTVDNKKVTIYPVYSVDMLIEWAAGYNRH